MTNAQRLLNTLSFEKRTERGAVLETFFPWDKTVDKWCKEGLPECFCSKNLYPEDKSFRELSLQDSMTDPVYKFEQFLGFDGVKRMAFRIPFQYFQEKEPIVCNEEDWIKLKNQIKEFLPRYCTDQSIKEVYGKYAEGHRNGDYSIRFRVSGFFWTPRTLLGIEEHLYAFYDMPEVLADMNQFITDVYMEYLDKIFNFIQPEVILLEEDLSGSTGPMISPSTFDEFIAPYYKQFFPFLKKKGVKNIFVDTDGEFNQLIPQFMEAGVDGFLPMDVNAGMDIVKVREKYPSLKFIGGYNKLKIEEGKEAIDLEFQRILPVIQSGGYVPGCDHQATPDTSFENYKYYCKKLKEIME